MQRYGRSGEPDKPVKISSLILQLEYEVGKIIDQLSMEQQLYNDGWGGRNLTPNEKRALGRAIKCHDVLRWLEAEWTPHMQEILEDFNGS